MGIGRTSASGSLPALAILAIVGGGLLIVSALGLAVTGISMLGGGAAVVPDPAGLPGPKPPSSPVEEKNVVPADLWDAFTQRGDEAPPLAVAGAPSGSVAGRQLPDDPVRSRMAEAGRRSDTSSADMPSNAEPLAEGRGEDLPVARSRQRTMPAQPRQPAVDGSGRRAGTARRPAEPGITPGQPAARAERAGPGRSASIAPSPMAAGGFRVARNSGIIGFSAGDVLVSRCGAAGPEPAAVIREALAAARESGVPACLNVVRGGSPQSDVPVRVGPGA